MQCQPVIDKLKAAGHADAQPASRSGILHWKMMLFAGQQQLEFAGANFAPFEFVPAQPYVNYTDEVDLLHERSVDWFRAS